MKKQQYTRVFSAVFDIDRILALNKLITLIKISNLRNKIRIIKTLSVLMLKNELMEIRIYFIKFKETLCFFCK